MMGQMESYTHPHTLQNTMVYLHEMSDDVAEKADVRLRTILSVKLVNRAWYYFRLGYSTYLTFLLGYLSTLVTVYYLAIKSIPSLLDVFPRFVPFAVIATAVGAPLAVIIGWVHLKRSALYSSEAEVAIESNPFNYKLQPGWVRDASGPATLLQLRLLHKLSETAGILTDQERAEIAELEKKWKTLVNGGYVGSPKRRLNF